MLLYIIIILLSVRLEMCINLTLGLVFTDDVTYGEHVKAEGLLLSSDHQYLHLDGSQAARVVSCSQIRTEIRSCQQRGAYMAGGGLQQ